MLALSKKTEDVLNAFFPDRFRDQARELIEDMCGNNLPFCENYNSEQMERIRFSALKLSEGRIDMLCDAIDLAARDWRDLLMAANFGHDPQSHLEWYNNRFGDRP